MLNPHTLTTRLIYALIVILIGIGLLYLNIKEIDTVVGTNIQLAKLSIWERINTTSRNLNNLIKSLIEATRLKEENISLKEEINKLKAQLLTQQLEEEENEVPISIVAINYPRYGYILVRLNQSIDPQRTYYVVTTDQRYVGTLNIEQKRQKYAKVRTFYASDAETIVILTRSKEIGILKNTAAGLRITDIPITAKVSVGEGVALFDESVPFLIPVGEVQSINPNPQTGDLDIIITPFWTTQSHSKLKLLER